MSQGDLDLLLNDGRSTVDMPRGYRLNPKPTSLLNSQRMSRPAPEGARRHGPSRSGQRPRDRRRKGLAALARVDASARSPLARAVTLYITATDLAGVVKPIQLWDKRVYERAYRGVFRFVYDNDGISQD